MSVVRPGSARNFTRLSGALSAIVTLATLLAGCQAPPQPTGPTQVTLRIADYPAFVDAALSRLRLCDFHPDYVDRTHGLIITEPTTSAQWFEPWRVDARGPYHALEASLHTIRRVVTVEIEGLDDAALAAQAAPLEPLTTMPAEPPQYRLSVRVDKARLSLPERQVTTSSGALNMYSPRYPSRAGLRGVWATRGEWVDLGRDALLEAFLLEKLTGLPPAGGELVEHEAPDPQHEKP